MDPFLESCAFWLGFHHKLNARIEETLNRSLPIPFVARMEAGQQVRVSALDSAGKPFEESAWFRRADVVVVDAGGQAAAPSALVAASPAPVRSTWNLPDREPTELTHVVVEDMRSREIVTQIETLSPSNKSSGLDRAAYLKKKQELLASATSLVEIDLLIGGYRSIPDLDRADSVLHTTPATPYLVTVFPGWLRTPHPQFDAYPTRLDQPLPRITVPLRENVAGVPLDLQAVFAGLYDAGAYDRSIDYQQPLDLPLTSELRRQVEAVLASETEG